MNQSSRTLTTAALALGMILMLNLAHAGPTQKLGDINVNDGGRPLPGQKNHYKAIAALAAANPHANKVTITFTTHWPAGSAFPLRVDYFPKKKELVSTFTRTNVREVFSNVTPEALAAHAADNPGMWHGVSERTGGAYKMETPPQAIGPKPPQSDWDGSVAIVVDYIKHNTVFPESVKFLEWGKVLPLGDSWTVWAKVRAKSNRGTFTANRYTFHIQDSKVVNVEALGE